MKKFLKWFISLAAIGSAIGLIIAYFCKDACCDDCCDDSQDVTEEDDFDLDSDLEPVPERDYVPLHRNEADNAVTEEAVDAEDISTTTTAKKEV